MTSKPEDPAKVVSLGGSEIHAYGDPPPWVAATGEPCLEQISGHIRQHLGPVATVFHELASDRVHIDVHVVQPTDDFPYVRLVTSGMSDLPMRTPDDPSLPRHAELLMSLPADWKLAQSDMQDERWYWPLRLLKFLARLPHSHDTWLGSGHTVPNGNPAAPYAGNTRLCGAVILPPVTTTEAFHTLEIPGDKVIAFYAVVPLHENEMNLKLHSGLGALLERFDRHGVSDIVDPGRKDTAARTFGWW